MSKAINQRNRMNVIVDASPLSQKSPTGISNFTYLALKNWAKNKNDIKFFLAAPAPLNKDFYRELSEFDNIDLTTYVGTGNTSPRLGRGIFWFLTKLPIDIYRSKADLFWSPAVIFPPLIRRPSKILLTIYDLVPLKFYETMKPGSRILYRFLFRRSIKNADFFWAISEYAIKELNSTLPETAKKPAYVGCAADHYNFRHTEGFKAEGLSYLRTQFNFNDTDKLLLFVGSLEPRKNLRHLIRLLPEFDNRNWKLVVVGGSSWGDVFSITDKELIERYSKTVVFLKRIDNDLLCKIYHAVDLFVSPSVNEGFCLPAIEAMLCGTPVALANNSAMSEIVGVGGVLIDGYENDAWIRAIEFALTNSFNPREQAKKFDWAKIGQDISDRITFTK